MPPEFVMQLEDVGKFYDDEPILKNISLSFYYGAKIGIVGENGAGKSTLLKIMAGIDKDIEGTAKHAKNMKIVYVPQEPQLNPEKNVRGNLEEAIKPIKDLTERYEDISTKMAEDISSEEMEALMEEMTKLQEKIDAVNGWEVDRQLDLAADALVLPPDEADVSRLSGGERRRVALCKALLESPDLLLLDEPTNHLDAETIAWLEDELRNYHGTVIIVTHDRYFLDNITKWILEIENTRGIPFEGNYSSWLEQKAERLRIMEKKETERQKILKRELSWIRNTPKGRLTQNKARLDRYEEMSGQNFEVSKSDILIQIPPGPKLGEKVLSFDNVCKGFNNQELLNNCTFELPKGAIVGIVGPNGAGKTTLFKMITGEEKPDSGNITLGPTVELSHVDQHRDHIDDNKTIFEEISNGLEEISLGDRKINSRAYVSRFNFRGKLQQKLTSQCSGGERNRIHLAKLLRTAGNLILLDEPTNDLDVNTMRVLEEALANFPACAMIISHDRFFLDRICTHLLIFEGDGGVKWFEGNFQSYEEQVLRAGKAERLSHRRTKYKKLPRI